MVSSVVKSIAQIDISLMLDGHAEPFQSSVWLELDVCDCIEGTCESCHRTLRFSAEAIRENDLVRCSWCHVEQHACDVLFEFRRDLLESAALPGITILIEKMKLELERAFRGSGLTFR
jgi:hypothetical protein